MKFDRGQVNALRLEGDYFGAHQYCVAHFLDPDAYAEAAFDYREGLGVEADPARALQLNRIAARLGSAQGMYQLGYYYHEHGDNSARVLKTIVALMKKAASLGSVEAQLFLARIYFQAAKGAGINAKQYRKEAIRLFRGCADADSLEALCCLTVCRANRFGLREIKTGVTVSPGGRLHLRGFRLHLALARERNKHQGRRWRHKKDASKKISIVELMEILESNPKSDRRCIASLRSHLRQIMETGRPKLAPK